MLIAVNREKVRKSRLKTIYFRCVNRIITEMGVFDVVDGGLLLIEKSPDVSIEDIKKVTEASFKVSTNLKVME